MSVQLDERPLRAPLDADPLRDPSLDAAARARISGGEGRAVQSKPQLALATSDRQRSLNHQNAIFHGRSDARAGAGFVRTGPAWIPVRPVDLVHDVRLRLVRRGGEREVGVTASVEQHPELRVDTTPAAVTTRVRQAPVAVNERITEPAVAVAREVA